MENEIYYLESVEKCQNSDFLDCDVTWLLNYSNGYKFVSFSVGELFKISVILTIQQIESAKY